AVLRPALGGRVARGRVGVAIAAGVGAVGGDTVFDGRLLHGFGAILGQSLVVRVAAERVGVPVHVHAPSRIPVEGGGDVADLRAPLGRQVGIVEREGRPGEGFKLRNGGGLARP